MIVYRLRMADTFHDRLRGLIGRVDGFLHTGELLGFADCRSIHTFGMIRPIDIVFFDGAGSVVYAEKRLVPARFRMRMDAYLVCERFAEDTPWFEMGDRVFIVEGFGEHTLEKVLYVQDKEKGKDDENLSKLQISDIR